MQTFKILLSLFFSCFLYGVTEGQIFYQVTATNGTQNIGGLNVAISSWGAVTTDTQCGVSPYAGSIGNDMSNLPGGYKYVFSSPVNCVRVHFVAINPDDTLSVTINGVHYNILYTDLSNFGGTCPLAPYSTVIHAGNLSSTDAGSNPVQLDIQPGYAIDSVEINELYSLGDGVIWDLFFLRCPGTITASASPDTLCSGDVLHLLADTAQMSVSSTFNWSGPDSFSSSMQNPIISSISTQVTGTYIVTAYTGPCTYTSSVNINVVPSPPPPLITTNSPLCASDTLRLNCTDSLPGIIFSWSGPNGFSSSTQNPVIINAQPSVSGIYYVTASLNNCSSTSTDSVLVNPILGPPLAVLDINPADTICVGESIALSLGVLIDAGSNPAFQWMKNGIDIVGAANSMYIDISVHTGDLFSCKITSNAACQAIDTAISNTIQMYVESPPSPNVSIASFPVHYSSGDTVTFTGHIPSADTGLSYQWTKNHKNIPGANTIIYTSDSLGSTDTICLVVHSPVRCAIPDSAIACLEMTTGINPARQSASEVSIFPNPANNVLYIRSVDNVNVIISGMERKTILQQMDARQIDISYLPDGIYMVQVFIKEGLLLKNEKLVKLRQ